MLAKTKPIRSQKLRDSARGEECTFQISGICKGDTSTVVLCHLPDESHGGSRKSDDICAAYGCDDCHSRIDGRIKWPAVSTKPAKLKSFSEMNEDALQIAWEREFYVRRAMVRTLRRMIEKGLVKIEGYKP